MKSKVVSLVLAAAIGAASVPPVVRADDDDDDRKAATVAEQIARAMPETPEISTETHVLVYTLQAVEAVEIGLGIAEATGAVALGFEIAGPLATAALVWLEIGGAHMEAINSLMRDEMLSGFSRGVVLGADERKPAYVKANFLKQSPVRNSVYPEYGTKLQNAYNQALAAGYAQGRKVAEKRELQLAFFRDIQARMRPHPSVTFGDDVKQWSDTDWRNYYIDAAAVFRGTHLE